MYRRFVLLACLVLLVLSVVATTRPKTPQAPQVQATSTAAKTRTPAPAPTRTPTPSPTPTESPTPTVTYTPTAVTESENIGQPTEPSVNQPTGRPADINPLTGLKMDDRAVLHRRPLMVRVGNDPEAWPQVSLNEADIVYEEIVEWWITRFTAIYLSQDPEVIRPIRSARLINLQLTPQYQGVLVNAGASDYIRWVLSQADFTSLDDYFVPGPFFFVPNEGWQSRQGFDATRARSYLRENGLDAEVSLRGFAFDQAVDWNSLPQEAVGQAGEIFIPYPAQSSKVTWRYDPASGKYQRFSLGQQLVDAAGKPLAADNVIIYFADHLKTDIVEDVTGATSVNIFVNGFNTGWVARDGKILKGNWATDGSQTPEFFFNDGRPIPLRPGNTWVAVVPLDYLITIDGVEHSRLGETASATAESPAAAATSTSNDAPEPGDAQPE